MARISDVRALLGGDSQLGWRWSSRVRVDARGFGIDFDLGMPVCQPLMQESAHASRSLLFRWDCWRFVIISFGISRNGK